MKKRNLNILLITQYFPPETGAGSNRAFEHSKRWVKAGAKVTVVTCMPNYPNGIIPEKYKGYKFYAEEIDGINVIRTYTFATPNKGFFKRTLSYFSFMFSSVIQGRKKTKDFDLVLATSPPFTVGISGWILAKIKKVPFVFEVRDLWPDSIIQLEQIKSKLIIAILRKIEIHLYKSASKIISVTDSYVPIISKHGIAEEKIAVIKNGVDINFFSPARCDDNLKSQLGLSNKFVVSYFGTFGLSHSLVTLLNSAKILKHNSDIQFLLLGDGAESEKLKKYKDVHKLENVHILKSVPKKELIRYYTISDIMVVILKGIPLFETVIPSKIFEIMSMQKPIILAVKGESERIINEAQSGETIEPDNSEALSQKIFNLYNQPDLLLKYGQNGRMFVEKNFDREVIANRLLNILYEVSSKSEN